MFKFLSEDGCIRASAVVCTEILNELRVLQETSPSSTLALGRTLVGATLLAARLKEEQAVALQIKCEGAMKMVFAQASYEGGVRAYVAEPQLPMSVNRGKLFIAPHVGSGTLSVSTFIKGNSQPQVSQVLLQTGEITEDIAHYLRTSLQLPCAITSAVTLGTEGVVMSAGGLMVEMMPGHTEEHIALVESCLQVMGPLSEMMGDGVTGEDIMKLFFLGVPGKIWLHPHEMQISCSCSRAKVTSSVQLLGADEVKEMIEAGETVTVKCEMCGRKYALVTNDLKDIYQSLRKMH
ncbi:MAG: Hsp33 family molecular chaperone HslO [Bdellovibrionaceae bacterium]|nr:Hsp33 family molecular chaperone HslO [Pseudobdellovibrionaceae bacterium]